MNVFKELNEYEEELDELERQLGRLRKENRELRLLVKKLESKIEVPIFCPACGETSEIDNDKISIAPAMTIIWTCPECKERWEIETQYNNEVSES